MYRCSICSAKRSSGMPQLRHAIYKPDGNIATELPVCQSCKTELDAGVPLAGLRKRYAVVEESSTTPAIVPVCLEIPKTAAEVAVCDPCHAMLANGIPLDAVAHKRGTRQPDPLPVPLTPVPAASMAPPVYRPVVLGARR